jgi:hypothetical protein
LCSPWNTWHAASPMLQEMHMEVQARSIARSATRKAREGGTDERSLGPD